MVAAALGAEARAGGLIADQVNYTFLAVNV
jgi:hypothetical protein